MISIRFVHLGRYRVFSAMSIIFCHSVQHVTLCRVTPHHRTSGPLLCWTPTPVCWPQWSLTETAQQAPSLKKRRIRYTLNSTEEEYIYYSYTRPAQKSMNQLFIKTSSSEERNCQKAATSGPHIVSKKPSTLNTVSWIKISVSVSRRSPAYWQKRSASAKFLSVNSSERHTKHSHNLSHRNCFLYTILNAMH